MVALEAQKAPVSEVDPFCREFFEDPFRAHEELREAGPVVRLQHYDVWRWRGQPRPAALGMP
jgi:hypothetical protein